MPRKISRSVRPSKRHTLTREFAELKAIVIANHGELIELRHASETNFRRVAELQVEVDRLKKLLVAV